MKPLGVHSPIIQHHSAVRTRLSPLPWLALILLFAAGLRVWGLGAKSLWLDEIMTVHKASLSFSGMMDEILKTDAHPPLFQIIEWGWLHLECGMSGGHGTERGVTSVYDDALSRIPAVVAGVLSVWLAFLIARRLFGRKAGLAAGFLTAISYFGIFYAQEARLHTLVTALFLVQTYLLLRILDCRGKAGWGLWAAYGIAGLASLYAYALCALTVGSLALLYVWITRRHNRPVRPGSGPAKGRQIGQWAAVHVVIALLFLPWVPTLHARTAALEASIRQHHDAIGRPTFAEITTGVASWAVGPLPWERLDHLGPLLGVGLTLAAALVLLLRKSKRPAKILGALFFIPLIGYLVLPIPRVHVYEAKHLIFLQPILLIALCGRPATSWRGRALLYAVVALVALLNAAGLDGYYGPEFEKENWRGLASGVGVQLKPADLVLFNPGYVGYAFDYYSRDGNDKAGAEMLLKPGASLPKDYGRIWLIEDRSAVARPSAQVAPALAALGWKAEESRRFPGSLGELSWTRWVRESDRKEPRP